MKKTTQKKQKIVYQVDIDVLNQLLIYLGISEFEHHQMLFNAGIQYLEGRNRTSQYIKLVKHKKWFWDWYKEQYMFLDAVFVANSYKENFERENKNELMKQYKALHEKIGYDCEITKTNTISELTLNQKQNINNPNKKH